LSTIYGEYRRTSGAVGRWRRVFLSSDNDVTCLQRSRHNDVRCLVSCLWPITG